MPTSIAGYKTFSLTVTDPQGEPALGAKVRFFIAGYPAGSAITGRRGLATIRVPETLDCVTFTVAWNEFLAQETVAVADGGFDLVLRADAHLPRVIPLAIQDADGGPIVAEGVVVLGSNEPQHVASSSAGTTEIVVPGSAGVVRLWIEINEGVRVVVEVPHDVGRVVARAPEAPVKTSPMTNHVTEHEVQEIAKLIRMTFTMEELALVTRREFQEDFSGQSGGSDYLKYCAGIRALDRLGEARRLVRALAAERPNSSEWQELAGRLSASAPNQGAATPPPADRPVPAPGAKPPAPAPAKPQNPTPGPKNRAKEGEQQKAGGGKEGGDVGEPGADDGGDEGEGGTSEPPPEPPPEEPPDPPPDPEPPPSNPPPPPPSGGRLITAGLILCGVGVLLLVGVFVTWALDPECVKGSEASVYNIVSWFGIAAFVFGIALLLGLIGEKERRRILQGFTSAAGIASMIVGTLSYFRGAAAIYSEDSSGCPEDVASAPVDPMEPDTGPRAELEPGCPAQRSPVPGGTFSYSRRHQGQRSVPEDVTVAAFCLDTLEVTVADFRRRCGRDRCGRPDSPSVTVGPVYSQFCRDLRNPDFDDHPINCVTLEEAAEYCGRVDDGRLPSDMEWAFAAGQDRHNHPYPWGDEDPGAAPVRFNYCDQDCVAHFRTLRLPRPNAAPGHDGHGTTAPVGLFNPYGNGPYAHRDLAGNVAEWTTLPAPLGPHQGGARGGAWTDANRNARWDDFRVDWVAPFSEGFRGAGLGFRCANDLGTEQRVLN